ncbi:uncharacterized protein LOC125872912 [Solanum stenotomum]|uniref:uncharacterized protein LOC125872912 n=1 Tax=Solanum stenotomum TaxID=172797 RepID=UPI0020D13849|nr:uncharacterized protein LOC125872912 [Solanum stenotomum]
MGHVAQSADVHAFRVEVVMSGMLKRAIGVALGPIRAEIREHQELIDGHKMAQDAFMVRVEAFEILNIPSANVPTSSEIPLPTTTGDVDRESVTIESDSETDDEELGIRDAAMYDDLVDLEGIMVEIVGQASLRETSMVSSSKAKNATEQGTNA